MGMPTVRNQPIIYRAGTSSYRVAFVESIVSGDTVNLATWDGSSWTQVTNVAMGAAIGQWQPSDVLTDIWSQVDDKVNLGGVNQAIQDAIDPDGHIDQAITARLNAYDPSDAVAAALAAAETYFIPGPPSTVSLALNTPRNPSAARSDSRPTRVTVSGGWSWSLNATGTVTGSLSMKSDSSSTPTTAVITLPFSRGISVGLSVGDSGTMPYSLQYDVAAGDSYTIATSGAGTFGASPLVVEQVL